MKYVPLISCIISLLLVAGCGQPPVASTKAESGSSSKGDGVKDDGPTPPATEFVNVTDPTEQAYTIDMPKGWSNRTYTARVEDLSTMVDTSISPNGSVIIFGGDPAMPGYTKPEAANEVTYAMARMTTKQKIEPFISAEEYFPPYVQRKFGKLPGFEIISSEADEEGRQKLQKQFDDRGVALRATTCNVTFKFMDGDKAMKALIMGTTCDGGPIWVATVSGIATTGEPKDYVEMVSHMDRSRKMSPEWQRLQQQKHEAAMAQIQRFGDQMTAQHNENMAWIQRSAAAHQQRMQAIWAQGDASMKSYNDRMASMDNNQQQFLNYIHEENTVVTSSGTPVQVDNSYQRYYVNKNDGSYVGGDITMDQDKLRRLGLNPDDYEEAKIKR